MYEVWREAYLVLRSRRGVRLPKSLAPRPDLRMGDLMLHERPSSEMWRSYFTGIESVARTLSTAR